MTARDGLPFAVFCTSEDLRVGLSARGFNNIPKSSNTIRSMVMQYAIKIRKIVINEISHEKKYWKAIQHDV